MIDLPPVKINVALNDGGLGDQICRMPAIIYCLKKYPHMSCDIWAPDYFVDLGRHFLRGYEERAQVIPISRMRAPLFNDKLMAVGFLNSFHTTLRTHLVDHSFNIMNDGLPDIEHRNYPKMRLDEIDTTDFHLVPGSYIALTPGYTAVVRSLEPQVWNEIAAWCMQNEYTPVWLGARALHSQGAAVIKAAFDESDIDFSVGIDLRDKTSLLEAGKLLALAKCVVGLDNGLLHLAGCSSVPLVAGYTSVSPEVRVPYRHSVLGWEVYTVEPEESLECRYCQVKFHFLYSQDFRECFTKKLDCVKQLNSKKFINRLKEVTA